MARVLYVVLLAAAIHGGSAQAGFGATIAGVPSDFGARPDASIAGPAQALRNAVDQSFARAGLDLVLGSRAVSFPGENPGGAPVSAPPGGARDVLGAAALPFLLASLAVLSALGIRPRT